MMILSSRWNERGIEDPWPTITRRNDQYRLVVSSIHGTRCYFIADHRTTKIASRPMMNYGEELGGRRPLKRLDPLIVRWRWKRRVIFRVPWDGYRKYSRKFCKPDFGLGSSHLSGISRMKLFSRNNVSDLRMKRTFVTFLFL